jgi:hypothetical protein
MVFMIKALKAVVVTKSESNRSVTSFLESFIRLGRGSAQARSVVVDAVDSEHFTLHFIRLPHKHERVQRPPKVYRGELF